MVPAPSPDWLELVKAIGTGVGLSLPVISTMGWFHSKRGERFDRIEKSVERFDTDLNGLIRQLGTIVSDVRVHESSIHRLDENIVQLSHTISENIGTLNDRLFEIARERRNDPHR